MGSGRRKAAEKKFPGLGKVRARVNAEVEKRAKQSQSAKKKT